MVGKTIYRIINTIALVLGLCLPFIYIQELQRGYKKWDWAVTEWLINYEGGFVRRGLPGQLILNAYHSFNVSPYFLLIISCSIFYFTLCFIIIRLCLTKGFPLMLLPTAFLLGGPVINNYWIRKDVFLMVCFIAVLLLIKQRAGKINFLVINLITSIALLCHEAFGFWGLISLVCFNYLNTITFKNERFAIKNLARSSLYFAPSIFIFLICMIYSGNITQATKIWDSWQLVYFPFSAGSSPSHPIGAVAALSWTLAQAVELSESLFSSYSHGIYEPIGILYTMVGVYFMMSYSPLIINKTAGNNGMVFIQEEKILQKEILARCVFFQLLTITPLFILGWDYGRWIFYWATSSLSIYLIMPAEVHRKMLQLTDQISTKNAFTRSIVQIFTFIDKYAMLLAQKSYSIIIYLFIGVSVVCWDLFTFLSTTPPGTIKRTIHIFEGYFQMSI